MTTQKSKTELRYKIKSKFGIHRKTMRLPIFNVRFQLKK